MAQPSADLVLTNGKFATLDATSSFASAVAIKGGKFAAVGNEADVESWKGSPTQVIDLHKRMVIPGLNDSHLHLIRGGLNITSNYGGMAYLPSPMPCAC